MNNRLKQFIAAENISQSQFADKIKVVRASVSHVMSGRNNPGYDFIKAIMQAYPNLNMEWLMLGKGKMYKETSSEIQHPASAPLPPPPPEDGTLFYEEDIFDDEDMPAANTHFSERAFTADNKLENIVNQRRISKIIVFFDDGSYQEMQ